MNRMRFSAAICFIICIVFTALADTTTVTILKSGRFAGDVRDIDFPTSTIGYAVGDDISFATNNFVAKTTDGGLTWMNITPALLTQRPWAVEFLSADTGFVGAYSGLLLRTTNGGSTWSVANTGGWTGNVQDIQFFSRLVGYACGTNSGGNTLLKTTDGGTNWSPINIGNTTTRYSILTVSDNVLLVSGSSGSVARTTDGGATWAATTVGTNTAYSLVRAGVNTVFCASSSQAFYKSTDQGQSFSLVFDRGASALYSVAMADSLNGLIVGSNGVNYRTNDGWMTFDSILVSSFTAQVCRTVIMKSATEILVGADMGNILRSTDRGTTWATTASATRYYALDFIDRNNGVAVGWRGTVIKTTNGGTTWTELRGLNGFELYDVKMFDANTFYSSGGSGRFYVTTNGGASFVERSLPVLTGGSAKALHFFNPNQGYCSGEMGRIYYTNNAGASWDSLYYVGASFNNVEDIYFVTDSLGFAFSERGQIIRTRNRVSWDTVGITRPAILTLWEAHFLNANVGYVASQNGSIYKTTNGGSSWSLQNDTTGFGAVDVIDIHVVDPLRRGFAVGEQGKLFKLVNATTWALDRTVVMEYGTSENLWGLDFVDTSRAFISGYYGTIYRLDVTTTATTGVDDGNVVGSYRLYQNYPNPFNPSTTIQYRIGQQAPTTLEIFDIVGQKVSTLVHTVQPAGEHIAHWNADGLAAGTYFYKLKSGSHIETRRMILLK